LVCLGENQDFLAPWNVFELHDCLRVASCRKVNPRPIRSASPAGYFIFSAVILTKSQHLDC
jgi:hypothetical protein